MDLTKIEKPFLIAQIREWIAAGECVEIALKPPAEDEAHEGIPLAISETFLSILTIKEWHADGLKVIPLDKVASISTLPERGKILEWHGVRTTNRYFWLDLESHTGLFQSLKKAGEFISVEDGDEFDVATVVAVAPDFVKLSAIDASGEWLDDFLDYSYKDMTVIGIDTEYANVLGAYCRETSPRR